VTILEEDFSSASGSLRSDYDADFGDGGAGPGDATQWVLHTVADGSTHAYDFVGGSHETAVTLGLASGALDLVVTDAVAGQVVLLGETMRQNIGGYRPRHDFSLLKNGVHLKYVGEPIAVAAGFSTSGGDFSQVDAIGVTALLGDASTSEISECWQRYTIQAGDISTDGTVTFRPVFQGTGTFVTNDANFPFTVSSIYPFNP
jgi:hypothetical protein